MVDVERVEVERAPGRWPTHLATNQLIRVLRQTNGDTISDAVLQETTGLDCTPGGKGYGYLETAKKHCENTDDRVWHRYPGSGCLKLLTPTEIVERSQATRRHIRRSGKRALRRLVTVDLKQLDDAERKAVLTSIAHVGTLTQFADMKTAKRLEEQNIQHPLDVRRLLEAMK